MPSMFGKAKPADQPFDLERELDRVLSAAERAGVTASMIETALEQCANSIRARRAVNINLSTRRTMPAGSAMSPGSTN
jgi:hypothetical protein